MNPPALLDVNLLIALFDPDHVHHEPAHLWFWPDDVSLRDSRRFDLAVAHRKLTDVYLLALAVAHEGEAARHLAVIDA